MPTFEERLDALERAQAIMKLEQVSDVRQLDERINTLQQQVAEQRRRFSEREQAIGQSINDIHKKN